jgi:diaminopimelate decarboxylase
VSENQTGPQGRPPAFSYQNSKQSPDAKGRGGRILCCEQVRLTTLAKRFGTPLYVYSGAAIRERVRAFEQAFAAVPHTLCYSVKANSNLAILRMLEGLGAGFDVVSGGELARVLRVERRAAKKVVFSGVGKTAMEMQAALKAGILLFNVESESELRVLAGCAAGLKRTARVALRVNPDVPADTHPYISTGLHQHKFGIPIGQAPDLYARAAQQKFLRVAGVSVHIGSQITDVKPFRASMERVAKLVRQLCAAGHAIEYVDAGGGLGIPYQEPEADFRIPVKAYAEALLGPLRGLGVHLLLEPGRSIVGPAGVLLTRVLYRKNNNGKKFVVVDAAMNDLLRPSLYKAYHDIAAVEVRGDAGRETVDVVGPVCETGDFFARDRELPAVEESDLLVLFDAGAYGMVLASNYNTRPRAAEIMVEGKITRVVRRRETLADLMRGEK